MIEYVQTFKYQGHVFGAESSAICANYALKRVAIDDEDEFPIAAKANQNNLYMENFLKSDDTLEEAINVFNQLQPFLLKNGFELKTWFTNCSRFTEENPEDLRKISDTKKVEMEPYKVGSSLLGLQSTVTEDNLQVCIGTSKKVETLITKRKILSIVFSVFEPVGTLAPFGVQLRRLVKSFLTKKEKHWDNSVEPEEEEEFLNGKVRFRMLPEPALVNDTSAQPRTKRKFLSSLTHRWTQIVR